MQARKLFIYSVLASLLALAFVPAQAADSSNVAVSVQETPYSVTYYGTFTFLGTGTESRFSKAFNVEGLDFSNAIFTYFGNAVSNIDADFFYHYAFEPKTISGGDSVEAAMFTEIATDTDVDAAGAAAETHVVSDSIGTAAERVFYKRARWLRIEADGQTGNPTTATVSWRLYLPKEAQDVIGRQAALGSTGFVKPTN